MEIQQITKDKRDYMYLLLMADPQEDMVDRYLDEGDMFILKDQGEVKTVCVVTLLKNHKCELKNIATLTEAQGKGYGRYMIHFVCEYYSNQCDTMYVGTGNSRKTIGFYEKCGFVNSHIVANFFVDHYKEPIYEEGIRLVDMIYLKKSLESKIDVKKVVDMAIEAGRILLKNGAEIFRVEETITRICKRFHVDHVDIFTLSHAIFVSAENGEEEAYTRVKHVPLSAPHLGIVAEVNDLSREISAGHVTINEAVERLKEIDAMPPKKAYVQILAGGIGSGFFGVMLGSTPLESAVAFVIGCLVNVWVLIGKRNHMSKIIVNIIGGALITAFTLLFQHLIFWNVMRIDGIIIGAIMPLVPGLAFVNAIRDIADSDFLSGTVRMIDALLVFVYIAIGVGCVLSLYYRLGGMI